MPRHLNKSQLVDLAEHLQGSCKSLTEGMHDLGFDEFDSDNAESRIEQEGNIFLCECGWWCEMSEQQEDGVCEDCYVPLDECPDCGENREDCECPFADEEEVCHGCGETDCDGDCQDEDED